MPALEIPKGKTLYDILELEKADVAGDSTLVKKAYRKLALKYHPDKQSAQATPEELDFATQQFQLVGYAYSILGDDSKRSHYDLTGSVDAAGFLAEDKNWTTFFKDLWQGEVNSDTIEAHALRYQGSQEEADDVVKYYQLMQGNMDHILAHVEHSKAADVPRFVNIIEDAIKNRKVKRYSKFAETTSESAQTRRIKKEQAEALKAEKLAAARKAKTGKAQQEKAFEDDKADNEDDIESDGGSDSDSDEAEEEEDDDQDDNSDNDNEGGQQEQGDVDDLESLRAMIQGRQRERKKQMDSMLDSMVEKATKKRITSKKGAVTRKVTTKNVKEATSKPKHQHTESTPSTKATKTAGKAAKINKKKDTKNAPVKDKGDDKVKQLGKGEGRRKQVETSTSSKIRSEKRKLGNDEVDAAVEPSSSKRNTKKAKSMK